MQSRSRSYPHWTPRVAVPETPTTANFWPYAVPIPQRFIEVCWYRVENILIREVYVWLRRNTEVGRWSFTMIRPPEQLAYQVRFVDPNEAFAFKMRWG